MSKIKVQILMSTYNGEKYIRKQLDSIMNQDIPVQPLYKRRRLIRQNCGHNKGI